jgi:hypothetical protein
MSVLINIIVPIIIGIFFIGCGSIYFFIKDYFSNKKYHHFPIISNKHFTPIWGLRDPYEIKYINKNDKTN